MNSRIRYVSNRCVWILDANGKDALRLVASLSKETTHLEPDLDKCAATSELDDEGLKALAEAANCRIQTGSFAALADTSPEIFVGKKMRYLHPGTFEKEEVTVIAPNPYCDGSWRIERPNCAVVWTTNDLLPITPPEPHKPKVRPYTMREFVEASHALDRRLIGSIGSSGTIYRLTQSEVEVKGDSRPQSVTFENLAKHWRWADDNSPCGVVTQ